jgi:hypothetical protein
MRQHAGKPTPSVATPIIETPTQNYKSRTRSFGIDTTGLKKTEAGAPSVAK